MKTVTAKSFSFFVAILALGFVFHFAHAASGSRQISKQPATKKATTSQTSVGWTAGCTGGKVMTLSKQCVCPSSKFESADGKQCLNACPAGQKADRRQKCAQEMMRADRQEMVILEMAEDEHIYDYTFEMWERAK